MLIRFTWGFIAVWMLGGCFRPDDFPVFIRARYTALDFGPAEGGQPPELELEGLRPSAEASLALRGAMHVWNLESGSEVAGAVYTSAPSFWSFRAESPLEDGWYLIATDLSGLLEDPRVNREIEPEHPAAWGDRLVVYSRFYVGSAPSWYATIVSEELELGAVSATNFSALVAQSEPVDAREGEVTISYDGAVQSCDVSWDDNAFSARCPALTDATSVTVAVNHPTLVGLRPDAPFIHTFVAPTGSLVLRDPDLGVESANALAGVFAP